VTGLFNDGRIVRKRSSNANECGHRFNACGVISSSPGSSVCLVVVVVVVVVKMSLRILGKDALVWPRREEGRKAIIHIVILIIVGVVLAEPSPKDRAALGCVRFLFMGCLNPLITAANDAVLLPWTLLPVFVLLLSFHSPLRLRGHWVQVDSNVNHSIYLLMC
jgi:hypothetical protein